MENELIKITDQDGSFITVHEVIEGERLIVSVVDEDDIPVGMWLDEGSATLLRDMLTKWLDR